MAGADAQDAGQEFADGHPARDDAASEMVRRLGLRHAAATHVGEHARQQESGQEAHERWDRKQPQPRRSKPEQTVADLIDASRKQHRGKSRDDADHNGQNQEKLIFAQPQLLSGSGWSRHGSAPPCWRPMRTSARSRGVAGEQALDVGRAIRSRRSTPASSVS